MHTDWVHIDCLLVEPRPQSGMDGDPTQEARSFTSDCTLPGERVLGTLPRCRLSYLTLWSKLSLGRQQACHATALIGQKTATTMLDNNHRARLTLMHALQPSAYRYPETRWPTLRGRTLLMPCQPRLAPIHAEHSAVSYTSNQAFQAPNSLEVTFIILGAEPFCFVTSSHTLLPIQVSQIF